MLIIPVCGEAESFLETLMQNQVGINVLLVVIINRPEGHEKTNTWHQKNLDFIANLHHTFTQIRSITLDHELYQQPKSAKGVFDLLLLNYNEAPFATKKGVGLARRIAADTALALISKKIVSKPWIFSTDADVTLPKNYFACIEHVNADSVALCLDFIHVTENSDYIQLQNQYDFKMRYYQQGIKLVGAAYDYIPLGSTLVINAEAYAQVRGFPCRSGGEDFYLLNKLAKIGRIAQPATSVVEIRSRISDRVPFGTGPALQNIKALQLQGGHYTYYHPLIFVVIRNWLECLKTYPTALILSAEDQGLNDYWNIEKVLAKARMNIKTSQRWQQFLHEWFDAFKILKSVHFLMNKYPSLSIKALLINEHYLAIKDHSN